MPRNGSGVYSLPQAPFVAGTTISSAAVNSNFSDIATALTGSLPTNGSAGMVGQLKAADGSSIAPSISFSNESNTGFFRAAAGTIGIDILGTEIGTISASGIMVPIQSGVPIGSVIDFAGPAAPTYWYLCYGQAVSRTTYSALFAIIGTTFGAGDGVTTFNLPDYRGNTSVGVDNMGGTAAGRLTTTYYGTNPDVLGNFGGTQSLGLATGNLPPYTPSGGISNGAITSSVSGGVVGGTLGNFQESAPQPGNVLIIYGTSITVTSTQATSSFFGNAQGGSSNPFTLVQPSLTINKLIYAGA